MIEKNLTILCLNCPLIVLGRINFSPYAGATVANDAFSHMILLEYDSLSTFCALRLMPEHLFYMYVNYGKDNFKSGNAFLMADGYLYRQHREPK